jgi:hypothetical protein
MAMPDFEQVDSVLAEDRRTVHLWGYEADETAWLATVYLPMPVAEEAFDDCLGDWRDLRNLVWWRP